MSYEVKAEKVIRKPANEVFRALSEGLLFITCSADSSSLQIDFRVGGKYRIEFKNHGVSNFGEFLEIVPNKKIVFSWCQTFGAEQKPDTQVSIELSENNSETRLNLLHTGFTTQENANDHQQGWDGGVADFGEELETGRLRMVRRFNAPIGEVYQACQNANEFSTLADFPRTAPAKKLSLSGNNVTLTFDVRENNGSALEIIQTDLRHAERMSARRKWEKSSESLANQVRKDGGT